MKATLKLHGRRTEVLLFQWLYCCNSAIGRSDAGVTQLLQVIKVTVTCEAVFVGLLFTLYVYR